MALLLVGIAALVMALSLVVSAGLLWLACRLFRLRWPATAGRPERPVGYRPALGVTLASNLVANLVAGIAGSLLIDNTAPASLIALVLLFCAVAFPISLLLLRVLMPVGWMKALGIFIVWQLFTAVQVGAFVLAMHVALWQGFIVPTGAMAETVLGYHKAVTCPQCGLEFPVNCSVEVDPFDGPPSYVWGCTCPNCRQNIALFRPQEPAREPAPGWAAIPDSGWRGGDRILVAKGLLGARVLPPQRFDLIVFPFPGMPGQPPPKAMNYVKRLIGLPGELVAIQRGKLFILPAEEVPQRADLPDEEPGFRFGSDEQAEELLAKGKFHLLRKPPTQVLALRRLVHDSRHPAVDLSGPEYRRWVAGQTSGWSDEGAGFRHNGKGNAVAWLRYRHVLRGAPEHRPQLITDFMGYNTWQSSTAHHPAPEENWASDLMLECEAELGPEGSLYLELSRGADRFQARFDLGKQTCTLVRLTRNDEPVVLKQTSVSLPRSTEVRLRFANVDERLIVWVDDHLPFGDGVEYDGPRNFVPVKENDLDRPASVGSEDAAVYVRHVRLFRDTYFTTAHGGNPTVADVPAFRPDDPETWRHLENAPVSAYRVSTGHYFTLGDNSAESSDSRSWGLVPAETVFGKVFLRYHPPPPDGSHRLKPAGQLMPPREMIEIRVFDSLMRQWRKMSLPP